MNFISNETERISFHIINLDRENTKDNYKKKFWKISGLWNNINVKNN